MGKIILRILGSAAALLLLLLFMPLFLIAVIIVALDSPGPIIFKQKRVGFNGRKFVLYKLRTMRKNANGDYPFHTQVKDPRFSRICRIIRATAIDEIPQLWNIIKGDMTFIGPRPELPKVVATYTAEQKNILKFRPGLLGISQLVLREGVKYQKKLKIENAYYPKRNMLKDIFIFTMTPIVLCDHALGQFLPFFPHRTEYVNTLWFKWLVVKNGDGALYEITEETGQKTQSKIDEKVHTQFMEQRN